MRYVVCAGCLALVGLNVIQGASESRQTVIKDGEGRIRVRIGEIQPGVFGLALGDPGDGPAIRLQVDKKRGARVDVLAGNGNAALVANARPDGSVELALTNPAGRRQLSMKLSPKGEPSVRLLDKQQLSMLELGHDSRGSRLRIRARDDGNVVGTLELGTQRDNRLLMEMYEAKVKRGLLLGQMQNGIVGMEVQEPRLATVTLGIDARRKRASLQVGGSREGAWVAMTKNESGGGGFAIGQKGRVLGTFGVSGNGKANLVIKDEKGVTRFDATK